MGGDWLYILQVCHKRCCQRFRGVEKLHPNASSAEETLLSSLGTVLKPQSTQGRWSAHLLPARQLRRASLGCLCALSIMPLL